MAIPASSERGDLLLASTRARLEDAIAELLNAIIAKSLPDGARRDHAVPIACDRSTSVTAQASGTEAALTDMIESLLDTLDVHDGGIGSFDLHGVMTGPDRCTIWGQACLDDPALHRALALESLTVTQEASGFTVVAALRGRD